jgi:hypothetical protein
MVRSARILLLSAVLAATAATARAQELPPPAPAAPPTPTFAPAFLPGPYFEVDPLLDRPPLPPPGWFTDVDLGVVIPHVKNHLTNQVQLAGATGPDTVQVGAAPLDWTVLPRFEVGYRLPSGFGACALSYRFLGTQGTGTTLGMDGPAALKSRLDLNEVSLDYISDETSLWPNWDMRWRVGLRLAFIYFDSRAEESQALAAAGSGIFAQRDSNWFGGAGLHAGLELGRQIDGTGLAFVMRGDFGLYLARIQQGFFEESTDGLAAQTRNSGSQGVPQMQLFFGLRWQPPRWRAADFSVGYQYEHWWDLGKLRDSTAELSEQGLALRAEFRF